MIAERLMVGSEFGRFESRLNGLRVIDGGHVEDDESNLIYMRARYYDPTSGRFLSEDPDEQGANWYVYCSNCPTTRSDFSGRSDAPGQFVYETIEKLAKDLGINLPPWFKASGELIADILLCLKCAESALVAFSISQTAYQWAGIGALLGMTGSAFFFGGLAAGEAVFGAACVAVSALYMYNAAIDLEVIALDEDF